MVTRRRGAPRPECSCFRFFEKSSESLDVDGYTAPRRAAPEMFLFSFSGKGSESLDVDASGWGRGVYILFGGLPKCVFEVKSAGGQKRISYSGVFLNAF